MTNYRRNRQEGGTYFFTVAIADRKRDLLVRHIDLFKTSLYTEKSQSPFILLGMVILPDHLHAIWRLPDGDTDFSNRWRRVKASFSRALPKTESVSESRASKNDHKFMMNSGCDVTGDDVLIRCVPDNEP